MDACWLLLMLNLYRNFDSSQSSCILVIYWFMKLNDLIYDWIKSNSLRYVNLTCLPFTLTQKRWLFLDSQEPLINKYLYKSFIRRYNTTLSDSYWYILYLRTVQVVFCCTVDIYLNICNNVASFLLFYTR